MSVSEYRLVPAAQNVKPLDGSLTWDSLKIAYRQHRAYADLTGAVSVGQRAAALATYAARFALLLAKRVIRYEVVPYEYREARTFAERTGFVRTALGNALGLNNAKPLVAEPTPFAAHLSANGVGVLTMPLSRTVEIEALAKPHFDALVARRGDRANRRAFDESRATADRRTSPELFAALEAVFAESGLTQAASTYMGRTAKLIDVNPQINDPSDSFWRDIFDDRPGDPLPRLAYCHRDASGGDLKAILYLSDVGPDNGPFTYAVGSNHMQISRVDDLLAEANDHNRLSGTDLESRRKFAALPAKLQQKGSFGNDLPDDNPVGARIADALWEIEAPKGSIVLFDTKGIHRGGMVDAGERRVITCVLG